MRCHPRSGELQGVYYNAHRPRDGQWVRAEDAPRSCSGRLIAYVALHGHGTYPSPGTVPRHFFLGNDLCRRGGPVWRPNKVTLLPTLQRYLDMTEKGAQGTDGGLWILPICHSRGSRLQKDEYSTDYHFTDLIQVENGYNKHVSSLQFAHLAPRVISSDPCHWLFFEGQWGATSAPRCQSWYNRAETPASRTAMQRLFFHFWPETE